MSKEKTQENIKPMKSIYRSIDNSMHEQLDAKELKKIENYFGENFGAETHFDSAGFDKACREYEASLCTISCSNPHSWEDGKEYEEGRDYKVKIGKQKMATDQQQWQQMSRLEKNEYFEKVVVPICPVCRKTECNGEFFPKISSNDEDFVSEEDLIKAQEEQWEYEAKKQPEPLNDEDELKFSLHDMISCWEAAVDYEYKSNYGSVPTTAPNITDFFKLKFNIHITKKP